MDKKDLEQLLRDGWRKDEDYVFVSYSSQDWEKVFPCVLELRARGINVFIDIEFEENSSSSWLSNLEERMIRSCECRGLVAFVSAGYLGSYACLTELIANRTSAQSRQKGGEPLPVFYIALDEALSTPQGISKRIYDKEVRMELVRQKVRIEPAEYTKMENYLLDCHLERYPDRQAVRSLLDWIRDRFNVATIMNELIFADTRLMPNIQLFEGAAECAERLTRNFVNDKNESIQLPVLEELRQRTCELLGRAPADSGQVPDTGPLQPEEARSPVDPEKLPPLERIRLQAEAGDADAQNNLGACYANGRGVAQSWERAARWYRKAAEGGEADAQYWLGVCCDEGRGVEQDQEEAVRWYRQAAEQGHAEAQDALGSCYDEGRGVEQDDEQAVYWFRRAAEQGHAGGQNDLGVCYMEGQGVERDEEEAARLFRQAAEAGDATAQYDLGICYADGRGVEQDDEQAVYWFRKAADQGSAAAQNRLGLCYEEGRGVEQDWDKAIQLYRQAAEAGNAAAQYNLGSCYEEGQGVEQDEEQAVLWYRKAAEQGSAEALEALGERSER